MLKYISILLVILFLAGCSNPNMEAQQWQAYYKAKEVQAAQPQQKQFDVAVSEDGKFQGITMYHSKPAVQITKPTKQFHPAWSIAGNVIQTAVPYAGFVLGAKTIGDSLTDIVKSGNNPVTYTNSNNTVGQDYSLGDMSNSANIAGQDYSLGDMSNGDRSFTASGDTNSTDESISSGGAYTGNDYYPDSSTSDTSTAYDNTNNTTVENTDDIP